MKILKVIHGYPMRFNAGSEVYSQTLCQRLSDKHEVQVFTREEDLLKPDFSYHTELDESDPRILLHLINCPRMRLGERYRYTQIDERFEQVLRDFQPDIVHIGHLNHLSTSIIQVAKQADIPIVYTLHDYWLICPRGQFLQRNSKDPWVLCSGQEDQKCATHCFSCRYSGANEERQKDIDYYTEWVSRRMQHIRSMVKCVDLFIAPSQYLMEKYQEYFQIEEKKLIYIDYGFELERLGQRKRKSGHPFTFGYIGTHIPSKGIHHLLIAFSKLQGEAELRIWGRSRDETITLKNIVKTFDYAVQKRIFWHAEYENKEIVRDVFNQVDAIVVPSIWMENSPLVIHEALQVGVPVITADAGGMKEYVQHNVNGLLFKHRDLNDLSLQMQKFSLDPKLADRLGKKRYVQSHDGNIPSIEDHVITLEDYYLNLLKRKGKDLPKKPGPWRITFDTNPDHCNFQCVMCECFSPHSKVKEERVKAGIKAHVMPIELIEKIMEASVGTPLREIIPSTMGEPLLYKHFDKIVDLCRKYRVKLNLTTNGSFPIRGVEAWARLIIPVGSDVKVSWNGATKETHEHIMKGSSWEQVTTNLKTFIRLRDEHAYATGDYCQVTLQLTFLESNVHELADIVKLAIDYGVDRVKGHHLWAHFKEIESLSMRKNKNSILRWNQAVEDAVSVADDCSLKNGKKILLENIYPLDESAQKDITPGGPCPFLGKEAWINTEGKFSPCCAPNELRDQLGEFGNLNEQSVQNIWESEAYQELRKNYPKNPLCVGCNMRKRL